MSVRISAAQLLEAFGGTYKSADVRIASIKEEDHWTNALTVVRLSRKSAEETAADHEILKKHYGEVRLDHFRILLSALSFSEWETFVGQCSDGVVRLGDFEAKLLEGIQISEQKAIIQRPRSELRTPEKWNWPSFEVWFGRHRPEKLLADDLGLELAAQGWSDPYQAMNSLFEINIWRSGPYVYDFYVSIPVFARIADVRFATTDRLLRLKCSRHQNAPNLRMIAVLKELASNRAEVVRDRSLLELTHETWETHIETLSASVSLTNGKKREHR